MMFLSCRRGAFAAYLLTSGSHSILENELDLKGPILKLVEKVIFRSFLRVFPAILNEAVLT